MVISSSCWFRLVSRLLFFLCGHLTIKFDKVPKHKACLSDREVWMRSSFLQWALNMTKTWIEDIYPLKPKLEAPGSCITEALWRISYVMCIDGTKAKLIAGLFHSVQSLKVISVHLASGSQSHSSRACKNWFYEFNQIKINQYMYWSLHIKPWKSTE